MFHSQNNERRYSSVVEHTLGKGGVVSPILTSGTIFKISAFIADFLFLNKRLFSPIFEVLKRAILTELADFLATIYYFNLADSVGISFCNCIIILFSAFL